MTDDELTPEDHTQHPAHVIGNEPLTYGAIREVGTQMNEMKHRLGLLGLFKTMHALDGATRALGWEAAEALEKLPR